MFRNRSSWQKACSKLLSVRGVRALRSALIPATLVLCLALTWPVSSQVGLCIQNPDPPALDNRDGVFVNLEEAPVHPMEFNRDSTELWVTNLPDARVGVFNVTAPLVPRLIAEVPVGLGPVTIRLRPPTLIQDGDELPDDPDGQLLEPGETHDFREMWVACQSSNAVYIVDTRSKRVKDTVRLLAEPSGLVFSDDGRQAFVTLAATHQIARVDTLNPQAPPVLYPFGSDFPLVAGAPFVEADEPRALIADGDDLYVLSYQSGNGTTGLNFNVIDTPIVNQWIGVPSLPEPPDRDVFRFSQSAPGAPGIAALWRMGTLDFDLKMGGVDGEIYVSTVDMLNDSRRGEFDYLQRGFAVHAVSRAFPSAGGTPQAGTVTIDLNDPANHHPAVASDDFRCAVPNEMIFSPNGSLLYVACYETRNVAVIDVATDLVIAEVRATAANRNGFGPRGVNLSPSGNTLYVYHRGDQKLQAFDVSGLAPGSVITGPAPVRVGYDNTPPSVVAGRFLAIDAANSASGLATCNTCHMDGHLDAISWDLSDFTGDTAADAAGPGLTGRVPKGSKVTMSFRGIEETPPFHWRGDRADLDAFNPAFAGLLGGSELSDAELPQFLGFVFSLSYPANPNQNLDRSYSTQALQGFDCFTMVSAHDVTADVTGLPPTLNPAGIISPSCAECHSMDGASGTLNQVNNPLVGLLADDATQLRGLWDKETQIVDYNAAYGGSAPPPYNSAPLNRIPASGWGMGNTGFADSVLDFVNLAVFTLPTGSQPNVDQFLREFDTGIAPAAAFAWTLRLGTAGNLATPALLTNQANNGHIDLVTRGWVRNGAGLPVSIGMLWDVPSQTFVTDDPMVFGPYTVAQLNTLAAGNNAVLTYLGVPRGTGRQKGIDRDLDQLEDGEEVRLWSSSPLNPDTDGDGFPDGYERRLGSHPALAGSIPPPESVAPVITAAPGISWTNSNVLKVRWTTDEESITEMEVYEVLGGGGTALVWSGLEPKLKKYHVMVGRKLLPGRTYQVRLKATDPVGNTSQLILANTTMRSHLFQSVHVTSTALAVSGTTPGVVSYSATFTVLDEDQQPYAGATLDFTLVEWEPGSGVPSTVSVPGTTATTNIAGQVTVSFTGTRSFSGPGEAEVFVTAINDPANRLYFHSLDGQFGHWDGVTVP